MYKTGIIIISGRKELAVKYKKILENLRQDAFWTGDLSVALDVIHNQRIEFIIISDTIKEKLNGFIEKIRALTYDFRPVIIAVSKSSDVSDRLEFLKAGADDVIGEEISKSELEMRLLAHIRRYVESFSNSITGLPERNITLKALRRSFNDKENHACLLIKIKGADLYRRRHGEIAWQKAIKTLGALTAQFSDKNDYLGHIKDDEMLLITNPAAAEKTASFLTYAYDNILNKFYSTDEFENNFTIQASDETKENREGLMRLNISSVESANFSDPEKLLNSLYDLISLLKNSQSSTYIMDRVKIKGDVKKYKKNKVLIYEPDSALSYLLQNVCSMNGIDVKVVLRDENLGQVYHNFKPDVVVLDWKIDGQMDVFEVARKIAKDKIKLISTSSLLNKKEILKSGADLYIPKPYDIEDMLKSIKSFLD